MSEITTTLVVQFSGGADAMLLAEIDDRADGYNAGTTQFKAGDEPHYLIYKTPNVTLGTQETSAGVVSAVESRTRSVTEILAFAKAREARTRYPIAGGLTYKWLGNAPGALAQQGYNSLVLPAPGVGVAKITYDTLFEAWKLSNVPQELNGETDFSVVIIVPGTTT